VLQSVLKRLMLVGAFSSRPPPTGLLKPAVQSQSREDTDTMTDTMADTGGGEAEKSPLAAWRSVAASDTAAVAGGGGGSLAGGGGEGEGGGEDEDEDATAAAVTLQAGIRANLARRRNAPPSPAGSGGRGRGRVVQLCASAPALQRAVA
jgi:hypothetical protein